jgi:zinc/manganese transport system ATP-binding protein
LEGVSFGWNKRCVVREVTGVFAAGSMTAIMGPNGAGKSTLIKGLMGVLPPMAGTLSLGTESGANVAWLPQAADCDRNFPITVYELVAMGAWRRVGAWRGFDQAERDRVQQALCTVNMGHAGRRVIGTLSGGQLQRVLFARLILQDATVLLLDEPFAAVDRHTVEDLMQLLHVYHAQGRTVIAVLHDAELVRTHFAQTLLLSEHVVAWGDTATVLTEKNLHITRAWRDRALA